MTKHYIIEDLQCGGHYSFQTTVEGIFDSCVEDYMTNDWTDKEVAELEPKFAAMNDQQKIEWVTDVYEYKFHAEPSEEIVKDWEEFTSEDWEEEKEKGNKRLDNETWENIFRNTDEAGEDIEVLWLDEVGGPGEWALCCGEELFEDGFSSEKEANERLEKLAKKYYGE